jgi:dipeptidyl-peptidase-4
MFPASFDRLTRRVLLTLAAMTLMVGVGKVLASSEPVSWQALRKQMLETRNFRLGQATSWQALPDGQTAFFLRAEPPSTALELYEFDVKSGQEKKILSGAQLVPEGEGGKISQEEKALRERLRLQTSGINFFYLEPKGRYILIPQSGKLFVFDRQRNRVQEIARGKQAIFGAKLSPDGKWVAYVRNSNVHVVSLQGGVERALTRGGNGIRTYGVAEFVAQEELGRQDGFWWSPDSKTLLLQEVDHTGVEQLVISDPGRPDAEPDRPYYPRPGKKNVSWRFGFVSVTGGSIRWIDVSREKPEYVAGVRWEQEQPTLQLLDRLQRKATLVQADPVNGRIKVLLREQDPAWVELEANLPRWSPDGQSFLWVSEREGFGVLELRSAKGELIRKLTRPELGYQQFLGTDAAARFAYLQASAASESSAIYRVEIASGKVELLHETVQGLTTASLLQKSPLYLLRQSTLAGEESLELRSFLDPTVHVIKSRTPEPVMKAKVELVKVGADEVRVAITRPSHFTASRRYPVIEQAYGGPGSQVVRASGRSYLGDQVMADALQVIVVRMDTRGTPGRGRDWERAIAGKFGSLPVEEHAAVLQQLLKTYPEMDEQRVGVTGWSYGGYFAAYAVLARPDVWKVGIAGAPPVDWLDYDTAYTERYLGLPQEAPAAYDRSSLLGLFKAGKSKQPLLVIHGTADDNVFFFNSLKLVDALERQGYPYEFLPLVGMTHMVSDPVLDERRFQRSLEFFKQHLGPEGATRS